MFARTDWEYVLNTFAFGYAIGYHFIASKEGSCNGNFLGIGMYMHMYVINTCQMLSISMVLSSCALGTSLYCMFAGADMAVSTFLNVHECACAKCSISVHYGPTGYYF